MCKLLNYVSFVNCVPSILLSMCLGRYIIVLSLVCSPFSKLSTWNPSLFVAAIMPLVKCLDIGENYRLRFSIDVSYLLLASTYFPI